MATNNSINVSTAGIVGFNGTAFVETTATNHAVLVGGATTSTFTNVGPTSTVGQVLQSAGASADPAFSTATYPLTTTINQILYSSAANTVTGITAANNGVLISGTTGVPSFLANGTTGQVLTATTGSPPSWGAAPSSFAPNTTIQLVDDFAGINTPLEGNYPWSVGGGSLFQFPTTAGDSGHNGVLTNIAFASTNGAQLFLNDNAGAVAPQMILGGGAMQLNWVFKIAILSVASPRFFVRCGFGDTTVADQVNGVYFEYTDDVNSGNWQFKTANASTRTTSNSSIAADTSYHNFQININAAGTSCTFFIDGVSLGSAITTNIPTAAITPFVMIDGNVGNPAANTFMVDLFYFTQTLTTPR